MDTFALNVDLQVSRPLADGLPATLRNCSLAVGPEPRFLQFLSQSNLVRTGDVTSSFQYHRPNGSQAMIEVVPMGGKLGEDACTVRHELTLTQSPAFVRLPDGAWGRQYHVLDAGSMQKCSPAQNRKNITPVPAQPMPGLLVCREGR